MSIDLSKMPKIGFGLMRLPENDGVIDIDKVSKMADSYLEAGFTYFDTAYVYHGGNSEKAVKEAIVKRHPRDSFTLATKLPAWFIHSMEDRDKLFNEQLGVIVLGDVAHFLILIDTLSGVVFVVGLAPLILFSVLHGAESGHYTDAAQLVFRVHYIHLVAE